MSRLSQPVRYAILVGGKEYREHELNLGFEELIDELETEFARRNFITIPMRNFVTAQRIGNILNVIEERCTRAARFPTILFYYAGHHDEKGFFLENGYYPRDELMWGLRRLRGEKLGIFDCCFAGMMKPYSSSDFSILAATAEDREAYADMRPGEEGRRLILGREILKFLKANPENFSLGQMFSEIKKEFGKQENQFQEPEMRGSNIFLFPGKP